MKYLSLTFCLFVLHSFFVFAKADKQPVLHYDFSSVNGAAVTDISGSGIEATLKGSAKVEKMGDYMVLDLGNQSGYLDMSEKVGLLFKELDSYTISMYYRVHEDANLSGNGFFLWTWSTSTSCTNISGAYSAYRLNAQRIANADAGYLTETTISINKQAPKGLWYHIVYRQSGGSGRLYLNGELIGKNASMKKNSELFGNVAPKYCFIGKAPFGGDNYLTNTLVYDIRLYAEALTEADIKQMAGLTESLDYAYRYGQTGDFTGLSAAVKEAEVFLETAQTDSYPSSAITEYEDVILLCKTVLSEGHSTQTIIDGYIAMLTAAKSKLKLAKGFIFDTSALREAYDTERGFRHPGGLHTAKDFERIRAQIAANNKDVTAAYNILKESFFAQSTTGTVADEYVIRGGGVGENYINCARAATTAYQNGLRWQIEGNRECAKNAVDVLMTWARTMKGIGGDSNYALAAGLYGYEFAQAAELVRDYDGWSEEDFNIFRRWMIDKWYSSASGFLRGRNGTWQGIVAGERPGHYWSNWGLCNALCVLSIGILCDDVFIYNQGLSFLKYDQTGLFNRNKENTTGPIYNHLCNEFWGGLIPVVHNDERGAYGKLGQMQESGRDQGHANMALGLAVDCAQTVWNQGDDLYSYMDNRLAAGIEWQAAWNLSYNEEEGKNEIDLPWTEYVYNAAGSAWHNAWNQSAAAPGCAIRNYWGRIIGHYEGVKGHRMPYSIECLNRMGIDGGGGGATSGGYDHLGYSVLTCTYNGIATNIPTLLKGYMEVNGSVIEHNELGGLNNTYINHPTDAVEPGTVIKLMPQISDTENTGNTEEGTWLWNTGETTKDITITAMRSQIYRVTYTNKNGVTSEQIFSIAVKDDCETVSITPYITVDDIEYNTNTLDIPYGKKVILTANAPSYYGYYQWDNGQIGTKIELPAVTRNRDVSVTFINAGGRMSILTFHLNVVSLSADAIINNKAFTDKNELIVEAGANVVLKPTPSGIISAGDFYWSDGSRNATLGLNDIQTSGSYTVTYSISETEIGTISYNIYVKEKSDRLLEPGEYLIRHRKSGKFLANKGTTVMLTDIDDTNQSSATWYINRLALPRYDFMSKLDNSYLRADGSFAAISYRPLRIAFAAGTNYAAIYTATPIYWTVSNDDNLNFTDCDELKEYPFEFIPAGEWDSYEVPEVGTEYTPEEYYSIDGIKSDKPRKGLNIIRMSNGTTKKIYIR